MLFNKQGGVTDSPPNYINPNKQHLLFTGIPSGGLFLFVKITYAANLPLKFGFVLGTLKNAHP